MSRNRYDTLDVNLNLQSIDSPKKPNQRFSSTVDFDASNISMHESSAGENSDRVNKFRDLYYKNEKLRQELKHLNTKLNEKLEKVKLVPIKHRKAHSVDLTINKPSKALQRELQNGYKQIEMYKKRIATLKVKEQSESTYEKYKTLDNALSYKDMEIAETEAQLKSIKNIKKIQERTMIDDLENEDLKEKLQQYRQQFKESQAKLKEIGRKARKRQQEYKKQQAYQISLQKKLRQGIAEEAEEEQIYQANQLKKEQKSLQREVSEKEFREVKAQIQSMKDANEVLQKKLDLGKKNIRDLKKQRASNEEKLKEAQSSLGALGLKIESYKRLIKDLEKKANQQQQAAQNRGSPKKSDQGPLDKSQKKDNLPIDLDSDEALDDDDSGNDSLNEDLMKPFQMSQLESQIHASKKEERGWKGKPRKVTFGFMDSNDSIHKFTGSLKGIKAWIDESNYICGLGLAYKDAQSQALREETVGSRADIELKWQLQPMDEISVIECSFTEQGYLSQMLIFTENGLSAKFGQQAARDKNKLSLDKREEISGFSAGVRKLGKDCRITELCFWVTGKGIKPTESQLKY